MDIDYVRENYMTVPQAAEYLGVNQPRIKQLCYSGRFPGAGKIDNIWLIPREAVENFTRLKPGKKKGGEKSHDK